MTRYMDKQTHSNAKRRLTRLTNQAERPDPLAEVFRAIVAEVNKTFAEWDAEGYAYPDDWHRWRVAKEDAEYQLRRMA